MIQTDELQEQSENTCGKFLNQLYEELNCKMAEKIQKYFLQENNFNFQGGDVGRNDVVVRCIQ